MKHWRIECWGDQSSSNSYVCDCNEVEAVLMECSEEEDILSCTTEPEENCLSDEEEFCLSDEEWCFDGYHVPHIPAPVPLNNPTAPTTQTPTAPTTQTPTAPTTQTPTAPTPVGGGVGAHMKPDGTSSLDIDREEPDNKIETCLTSHCINNLLSRSGQCKDCEPVLEQAVNENHPLKSKICQKRPEVPGCQSTDTDDISIEDIEMPQVPGVLPDNKTFCGEPDQVTRNRCATDGAPSVHASTAFTQLQLLRVERNVPPLNHHPSLIRMAQAFYDNYPPNEPFGTPKGKEDDPHFKALAERAEKFDKERFGFSDIWGAAAHYCYPISVTQLSWLYGDGPADPDDLFESFLSKHTTLMGDELSDIGIFLQENDPPNGKFKFVFFLGFLRPNDCFLQA